METQHDLAGAGGPPRQTVPGESPGVREVVKATGTAFIQDTYGGAASHANLDWSATACAVMLDQCLAHLLDLYEKDNGGKGWFYGNVKQDGVLLEDCFFLPAVAGLPDAPIGPIPVVVLASPVGSPVEDGKMLDQKRYQDIR